MAIKRYKPTSPARRFMTVSAYAELTGDKPEKSLMHDKRKSGGRNNQGKISVRHIGGGNKSSTELSTSNATRTVSPQRLSQFSTTPTVRRTSRFWRMPTAKRDTFSHPSGLPSAIRLSRAQARSIKERQRAFACGHPRRYRRSRNRA